MQPSHPAGEADEGSFASRVLVWFDEHGRKHLPWQRPATPYRVWVSEIMLQQTQVATVIPYFERFMRRFDSVAALADAPLDEVLGHWSGLGYYARARNLHAAARACVDRHDGNLPHGAEALQALPGIGRSTAGAIASLAMGRREPILDGNVKRVLCRHAAVEGWPGTAAVTKTLWALAEARTPHARVAEYTQAIMDLGATLCRRTGPACLVCPVQSDCRARIESRVGELPAPRPKKARPLRATRWLVVSDAENRLLLVRRPPSGVWGGLWSFPECGRGDDLESELGKHVERPLPRCEAMERMRHGFTHFELDIEPVRLRAARATEQLHDADSGWFRVEEAEELGVPAPARRMLERLASEG